MINPRLATRYAKSIMGLAVEQNIVEEIHSDMKFISAVCKTNRDFVSILKSPIFSADKKEKLIRAVVESRVSKATVLFVNLLIRKTRENALPEISEAFIEQYNQRKGIHKVKLTTAAPVSDELRNIIVEKVKSNTPIKNIEMDVAVNEKLIGGFKLQIGDVLIDASILRDLIDVKNQFLNNDYIHRIR